MVKEYPERRWSKTSLASLIVLVLGIVICFLAFTQIGGGVYLLLSPLFIVLIILSIISLVKIKRHNLKGKWLSIIILILAIIGFVLSLIAWVFAGLLIYALSPKTIYQYEVPLNVYIKGSNFEINEIQTNEKPELWIMTRNKTETIPEDCLPDGISFDLDSSIELLHITPYKYNYTGIYRGSYDGPVGATNMLDRQVRATYPVSEVKTYPLKLSEEKNKPGSSKKLLSSYKDLFYIYGGLIPFTNSNRLMKYYPNLSNLDAIGCQLIDHTPAIMSESGLQDYSVLKITGTSNKETKIFRKVACLKQFDNYAFTAEGCTFFELKSQIDINAEIDLEKGRQTSYVYRPHL